MGNKTSTLTKTASRISRQDRERLRAHRVEENKVLARQQYREDNEIHRAIQQQVDRGDLALTKNDLVAILMRLRPEAGNSPQAIRDSLTVRDLTVLIRESLYTTIAVPRQTATESLPIALPNRPGLPSLPSSSSAIMIKK